MFVDHVWALFLLAYTPMVGIVSCRDGSGGLAVDLLESIFCFLLHGMAWLLGHTYKLGGGLSLFGFRSEVHAAQLVQRWVGVISDLLLLFPSACPQFREPIYRPYSMPGRLADIPGVLYPSSVSCGGIRRGFVYTAGTR